MKISLSISPQGSTLIPLKPTFFAIHASHSSQKKKGDSCRFFGRRRKYAVKSRPRTLSRSVIHLFIWNLSKAVTTEIERKLYMSHSAQVPQADKEALVEKVG